MAAVAVAALVASCSTSSEEPPTETTGAPDLKTSLRVAYGGVAQLQYSASRVAWQELNDQGWDITEEFLPQAELAIQALEQGAVDIVPTASSTAMKAIESGADIVGLVAVSRAEWALVGHAGITSAAELSGKKIAVHSETSLSNLVVQYTLNENDIDDAEVLMIPGSPARSQALAQGQIDATSLFVADALRLQQSDASFSIIETYSNLPFVDQLLWVRRDFVETHRAELQAILSALLETYERFGDDLDWAAAESGALMPDEPEDLVRAVVEEYKQIGVWPADGGIPSYEFFEDTIAFLKRGNVLGAAASDDPRDYIDLSILEEVR
ncbi:MAG: ABC transporter substrate-binding protein [Cryobacterium sp.]|nr:ABC transporter substrate-binding protein [Cryobacterium sp.]